MRNPRLVSAFARRAMFAGAAALLIFAGAPYARPAQSSGGPPEAKPSGGSILRIELTGGEAKKPIVDASVYLKFTEVKTVRDKKIELNLKTNQSGVARSPEVPKGRVLIQVVAPGWKTFGQYYNIARDEQTIQINLERPSTRWLRQ